MVAPIVTSASPSVGQGASGRNITITGSGFANGAYTTFPAGITSNYTQYVSPTQLIANVTVAGTTSPGNYDVTVVDPGNGVGVCSGCLTVTQGPSLTGVAPTSRGQGATAQHIVVTGTNLAPGAAVAFSGTGITIDSTNVVSPTEVDVTIDIANSAALGTRAVTVTNPDGGSATCAACFTVNKGPSVTDWNPTTSPVGFYHWDNEWRGDHWELREMYTTGVLVTGSGFAPGATVTYSGSAFITVNSTTFVSSGKIKQNITVDVLDFAAHGLPTDRAITVTNPDGGAFTCQGCVVLLV